MKIESTIKVNYQYCDELQTFEPSDIFHIPFKSVRLCVDNGDMEGPWISLLGDEGKVTIQFESEFPYGNLKDRDAKMFLRTLGNIIYKNQIPIEFSVDHQCRDVSPKIVNKAA